MEKNKILTLPSYEVLYHTLPIGYKGKTIEHLYEISEDEIKEGDWFICISAKGWIPQPILCGGVNVLGGGSGGYIYAFVTNHTTPTKSDYRKIVASSNPLLIYPKGILIKWFEKYPESKVKELYKN